MNTHQFNELANQLRTITTAARAVASRRNVKLNGDNLAMIDHAIYGFLHIVDSTIVPLTRKQIDKLTAKLYEIEKAARKGDDDAEGNAATEVLWMVQKFEQRTARKLAA